MKRTLKTAFLLLFVFAFLGNGVLAREDKGPKIVIKEPIYDSGDVQEGEDIEHSFQIFNEGDEILEISKVRPG